MTNREKVLARYPRAVCRKTDFSSDGKSKPIYQIGFDDFKADKYIDFHMTSYFLTEDAAWASAAKRIEQEQGS